MITNWSFHIIWIPFFSFFNSFGALDQLDIYQRKRHVFKVSCFRLCSTRWPEGTSIHLLLLISLIPYWGQGATHYTNNTFKQAFVSEYAVTPKADAGTGSLLAALAEAGFLLGLERNRSVWFIEFNFMFLVCYYAYLNVFEAICTKNYLCFCTIIASLTIYKIRSWGIILCVLL